ncbi:hypothetical protein JQM34_0001694 [Streptococcus oralis]|uniref:hypothetical protein n=1 Tax=Streptococcus phage SM1 TaxID=157924 RepID=UPI000009B255|nr:hypothetical protein [Streptococcus oralis]NP_862892.1 hypothetical protein SM1p53 [Streptococcus phage SM1]AAK37662.1 unknown [Streptococcus phage SM1]QQL00449.1 hypothetical protein JDY60_00045 [Streptococcus oralis]QRO08227.1 hypothetical protein JQM34_0001694 [Streptococcus oralis]
MAISNYELATKPYLRGFGDKVTTVVEIRLQDGNRYSTNQRELSGDRTQDQEDVLIQAVLDIVKSELDPGAAIVKTQTQLEQAEQQIAHNKSEQDRLSALANKIDKVVRVMAQDSIMGEKIAYGTTYKELVELFPLAEEGKAYQPGDIFVIEDPEHVELNGEGKRVLIQTNQSFTYKGESIKQLEGVPSQNGLLAVWKWEGQKNESNPETNRVSAQ